VKASKVRKRLQIQDPIGYELLCSSMRLKSAEGLPIGAIMGHLDSRCIFDGVGATRCEAEAYLKGLSDGTTTGVLVSPCEFPPLEADRVGKAQVMAFLDWLALQKGLTFSEIVSRLINHGSQAPRDRSEMPSKPQQPVRPQSAGPRYMDRGRSSKPRIESGRRSPRPAR